jgi:hypothetical protein
MYKVLLVKGPCFSVLTYQQVGFASMVNAKFMLFRTLFFVLNTLKYLLLSVYTTM